MNTVFAISPPLADGSLLGLFGGLFDGELHVRGRFAQDFFLRIGLAVLALASVVAVGVLYAKEIGRLGVARRLMLAAVRMTTVLVVAFLLLRPVWVNETTGSKPRPVAILIDVSESMNSKDPRPALEDQG